MEVPSPPGSWKGTLAETLFVSEVISRGGWVYLPVMNSDEVDVIVRTESESHMVQVKYAISNRMTLNATGPRRENPRAYLHLDYFAYLYQSTWHIIPFAELTGKKKLNVNNHPGSANAWHLLGLSPEPFNLN